MCGIVGFQGDFDPALLEPMIAAVAHRGPDADGRVVFHDTRGITGLGHRRLAIIDLSPAGHQPMMLDRAQGVGEPRGESGLTLIYNGEIYNYRELRAELAGLGHTFVSHSDSEVLLHLYERYGPAMVERLNGIFTFAICDRRAAGRPDGVAHGTLFIARDHLGVKPLYFAQHARGFAFASEIKALLCDPALPRDLDPVAIHQTLAYLWTPAPRTALAAVRKLEPGSALLVHRGRIARQWSYYVQPYAGELDPRPAPQLAEALAAEVAAAVRRQLVSDVPVGAFLSGGLDSSAVVAMMRRAEPQTRIPCFSIGFAPGVESDNDADLPYARRVAQHLDVDLEEIVITPDAIARLPQMVWLMDEPQADPAPINALIIAEHARARGIPVLLSGAGGDDLFGGYRRHWALQFERRWSWLPHAVRAGLQGFAGGLASGGGRGQQHTAVRRFAKMFAHAAEPADRRLVSYFYWSTEGVRRALYTPGFAAAVGDADTAAPLLQSLELIPRETDRLQRMLFLETRHFLADHNLNYTDRAGMAVAVEVRTPLIDVELANFATRIPAAFKQEGRTGKAIFKRAMEPYLPRDIIYRPKSGFGVPLRRWLRHELREMVDDTLSAHSLRRRGLFEPAAVARLVELDRAGAVDGSYTLYALMTFELWCRQFVDSAKA